MHYHVQSPEASGCLLPDHMSVIVPVTLNTPTFCQLVCLWYQTVVCYQYVHVSRVRRHTWELKCISSFCRFAPWHLHGAGDGGFIWFFCAFLTTFYIMIHTADLSCQQDRTAVIKKVNKVPWRLQCPCGVIYKQDFSSLHWPFSDRRRKPTLLCLIRKWTEKRRSFKLNAEPSHSGNWCLVFFFRAGKTLQKTLRFISHTEADNSWERERCTFPLFLCLLFFLMCCLLYPSHSYQTFSLFSISLTLHTEEAMKENKSNRGHKEKLQRDRRR